MKRRIPVPDAESMLLKTQLASTIKRILEDKDLTQTRAAEMLGISQPKLSGFLDNGDPFPLAFQNQGTLPRRKGGARSE